MEENKIEKIDYFEDYNKILGITLIFHLNLTNFVK